MNEDALNISIRKFLKMVGIKSQREIEHAIEQGMAQRALSGNEAFPALMTLEVPGLKLNVRFEGDIRLE